MLSFALILDVFWLWQIDDGQRILARQARRFRAASTP
jgi:hypothetical protein